MTWLLCDYGEVLCLPQTLADREAIESFAQLSGTEFWASYWSHRRAYDRADLTAKEYWTAVLGASPTSAQLEAIIDVDAASWIHPNGATLNAASRSAERGVRLAIFSNAPFEIADAIASRDWLADFSPKVFSCHLGTVKPEPDAYLGALEALSARPDDVVFFDDRPENVLAARSIGMRAEVFTDPAQFEQVQLG